MRKRDYPGAHTREQWRTLDRARRRDLVKRAQADLLGSFRHCTDKSCCRHRTCAAADPNACVERLWRRRKVKPKLLRNAYARLEDLNYE